MGKVAWIIQLSHLTTSLFLRHNPLISPEFEGATTELECLLYKRQSF
jgi:hypothetical protein